MNHLVTNDGLFGVTSVIGNRQRMWRGTSRFASIRPHAGRKKREIRAGERVDMVSESFVLKKEGTGKRGVRLEAAIGSRRGHGEKKAANV